MDVGIQNSENLQPSRILERGDNSLDLQVIVEAVNTLFPANATHFIASKWDRCVKNIEAIDPYGSSSQCPHHGVCSFKISCENTSSQTIACLVCSFYHFVDIPDIGLKLGQKSVID